jgi:hypothetical protein
MSGHGNHGHGSAGTSDSVDYGKVIGVGIASLIIFALSIWWAASLMHGAQTASEAKAGRARDFDTHRTEIGIVDQAPFVGDKRLHQWRNDRKHELESYGWVDKGRGVVRIPVEQAMDKVAGGAMPAGAPQ